MGATESAVANSDAEWFDKGRERLRSAMALTDAGKAEADVVAARLQQLEREQIAMHSALQQLEAARADGAIGDGGSGGITGAVGRGLWLMVELFITLGLLVVPLGSATPTPSVPTLSMRGPRVKRVISISSVLLVCLIWVYSVFITRNISNRPSWTAAQSAPAAFG